MTEPVTQIQDHERRIGRLEGIAELLTEQGRQFNARFESMERVIVELRRETNARFESMERVIAELRRETNARFESMERTIRETNARIDSLTRWLVGMQVASLLAVGGLLVSILLKLN